MWPNTVFISYKKPNPSQERVPFHGCLLVDLNQSSNLQGRKKKKKTVMKKQSQVPMSSQLTSPSEHLLFLVLLWNPTLDNI